MSGNNLVIDVEATGQHPSTYAMVQIGAVDLRGNEFYGELRPDQYHEYDEGAMNAIGLTREDVLKYPSAETTMQFFRDWVKDTYKGERVVTWSDNPAFDWQFVNFYFHVYCKGNPLGHSMRRIGDFYAGITGNVKNASRWKKLRETKHTHNALDDARGNAEALAKILRMQK
jgi:DNA polymerase III epsilon subunit-like protein